MDSFLGEVESATCRAWKGKELDSLVSEADSGGQMVLGGDFGEPTRCL